MSLDYAAMGGWFAPEEPNLDARYREEYMTKQRATPVTKTDKGDEQPEVAPDFGLLEAVRLVRTAGFLSAI